MTLSKKHRAIVSEKILEKKEIHVYRRKPTRPEPILEILKVIPGAIFAFQLSDERSVAMPYVSDRFMCLTGLRPEEVVENAAPLLARIHPQDIEPFFTSAEESANAMMPWHLEFRLDLLDFIAKLAALVPKPRVNLTRFARIIPDTHPLRGPAEAVQNHSR